MYKKGRVNSNSRIISTDEDPSLRIESSAIINLRGVSTKLNKYIVFTMQTYKKLILHKLVKITLYLLHSYPNVNILYRHRNCVIALPSANDIQYYSKGPCW